MHRKSDLLVCDLDNQSYNSKYDVIYLSSYTSSKSDGIFSLPQLVEDSADHLKTEYLKLIYEFGEAKVNGKRIIDHLKIRQNFSYWWMTLFVEKCNYAKSPQIDNIIKLMALEQWLKENRYQKLKLVTGNAELARSVSLLAKRLLIDFEWKKEKNVSSNQTLAKKVFHSLPSIIQSPIWLIHYLFYNWPLKGVGVKEWRKTTANTTFVSYLFNLSPEATRQGHYESPYWTKLTNLLDENLYSTNWLHIYIKDSLLSSSKKVDALLRTFNNKGNAKQTHVTLASFLSLSLVIHTLKDWYKVLKFKKNVCKQVELKSDYLWPLFEKDCQSSMSGVASISNLLNFNLFERAMTELPIQNRGCYLQENQGWELGFISAWRSAGHSKNLIGLPHSTVRYWDLRYFFDPRNYAYKGKNDMPIPDYIGVNGPVMKNSYINGGYPQERLIEVEALRYLHINNSSVTKIKNNKNRPQITLLVVGDYLQGITSTQLALLNAAFKDIEHSIRYIIKPHPGCPINKRDLPDLNCEISSQPIGELLLISDIVYSSSATSAAVDAYCAGKMVIIVLDGKSLNLSPLRGFGGVYFVTSAKELVVAINGADLKDLGQRKDFFHLDTELPRWKKWLTDESINEVVPKEIDKINYDWSMN